MRPGARGGWVNGSLAWNELEWQVHANGLRADHVAVARELYAAQRAGRVGVRHLYSYGAEKSLDLTDCGAQLWSLLDEAARIGVHLVHAGKGLGEIAAMRGVTERTVQRHWDKARLYLLHALGPA